MNHKQELMNIFQAIQNGAKKAETDEMLTKWFRDDFCEKSGLTEQEAVEYFRYHDDLRALNSRIAKGEDYCKNVDDNHGAKKMLERLKEDRKMLIGAINELHERIELTMDAF